MTDWEENNVGLCGVAAERREQRCCRASVQTYKSECKNANATKARFNAVKCKFSSCHRSTDCKRSAQRRRSLLAYFRIWCRCLAISNLQKVWLFLFFSPFSIQHREWTHMTWFFTHTCSAAQMTIIIIPALVICPTLTCQAAYLSDSFRGPVLGP